jgi:DEAD/DEAH box helicase domain-containing protein
VVPEWIREKVRAKGLDFDGGIHGIEHASIGMLPLLAIADRNDVGGVSHPNHPDLSKPAIFIYDAHPGGVGIAQHCYQTLDQLLMAVRDAISVCECETGCPSCIQSPRCGNNNQPLDKQASLLILNYLLSPTSQLK